MQDTAVYPRLRLCWEVLSFGAFLVHGPWLRNPSAWYAALPHACWFNN